MSPASGRFNTRLALLGGVAAVAIGVGIGLEGVPWLAKSAAPEPADGGFGVWPLQPQLPPSPAGPAAPAAKAKPEGYEKLLALFDRSKDEPTAQAFTEAFKKEPSLKKAWEDYQKDQESDEPEQDAGQFAEEIASKPEFRQLVARFAGDPGFHQLALGLAQIPEIRPAVQRELARADSAARLTRSHVTLFRGQAGGKVNASTSVGDTRTAFAAPDGPGGAGVEEAAKASAGSASTAGAPKKDEDRKDKSDPDGGGYAVDPKLASVSDGGGGVGIREALAKLCFGKAEGISQDECRDIGKYLGKPYGIWGACIMADLYERCVQICRDEPTLNCSAPPGCYATCVTEIADPLTGTGALTKAQCASRCKVKDPDPKARPKALFGYDVDKKTGKVTKNEYEAGVIELVYTLVADYNGDLGNVRDEMKKRGYTTAARFNRKRGKALDTNSIGGLLNRDFYCRKIKDSHYFPILPKTVCDRVSGLRLKL